MNTNMSKQLGTQCYMDNINPFQTQFALGNFKDQGEMVDIKEMKNLNIKLIFYFFSSITFLISI